MKNENVILQAARPSKQTVKKEAVKKEDTAKQMSAEDWFQLGKKADNEKNYSEAVKWYLKAAEQGYADAQNNLGFCYDNGKGVEKDPKQAVYWYQKAAEQGYASAQFNLGLCYENGKGVEQDQKQALSWYQKAADQGDEDAKAKVKQLTKKKRWFF